MKADTPSPAAIKAWFTAHEADLALTGGEDGELAPEHTASLNALFLSTDQSVVRLMPGMPGPGSWPHDLDEATHALVGLAVGSCFGRAPSMRSLMAADAIVRSVAGWQAFSEAAADELAADPSRSAILETCLGELVHAFTWAPRRIVRTYRDNMCALVERFRRQPRLDDAWSGGHSRIMLVRHAPAFDALRLADPAGFLRLLDRFPHPEPGRHLIAYSSGRMDLGGLIGLLRLARPCFRAGVWLPWIKSSILVVAAIEEKLAAIGETEGETCAGPSEAFAASTARALAAVLARADGNDLGHAWLQRLMHGHAFRHRRTADTGPARLRHRHLLVELASALSPKGEAARWVGAEQDVWRRDRAVAALAAAGLGDVGSQTSAEGLMLKLLSLGLWTTGLEASFSHPSTPERWLIAALIDRHSDPVTWFDALWHSLAPIRDRARHASLPAGGHAGDATVIAVTWFLFGLDALDPREPAHRALWRSLLLAVRECSLAQVSPLAQPSWRARYQLLAAHLAIRLVADANAAATDDLRELLGPLLCLDMMLAEVLAVLCQAGVAPVVIANAVDQTARLVALLRRLEVEQVWREEFQQEQLGRHSVFSREITRLADAIEAAASPRIDPSASTRFGGWGAEEDDRG